MSERQVFAETISDYSDGNHMANECERFGMMWGCREDCPSLEKGNCELYEDVDDFLKQAQDLDWR